MDVETFAGVCRCVSGWASAAFPNVGASGGLGSRLKAVLPEVVELARMWVADEALQARREPMDGERDRELEALAALQERRRKNRSKLGGEVPEPDADRRALSNWRADDRTARSGGRVCRLLLLGRGHHDDRWRATRCRLLLSFTGKDDPRMSAAGYPQIFAGISNENEFFSHHYLSELFEGDIKDDGQAVERGRRGH